MKVLFLSLLFFIFSFLNFTHTTNADNNGINGGDLMISNENIGFSANPIIVDKEVNIYANIHNKSNNDLNGIVKFFDEKTSQNIGTDVPFSIIGKDSHTLFATVKFNEYGHHTIAVSIIPFTREGDNNDNNVAYKKIFVDTDIDGDSIADSIDPDIDGDKINNDKDAFPKNGKEWIDTDKDGMGNNADTDDDNDGFSDIEDYLPLDANENLDTDKDKIGNKADTDDDNDGINDDEEVLTDPLKYDTDGDGTNDKEDLFPLDGKRNIDTDNDGTSNFDDIDDDNDGINDQDDAFPLDKTEWQDSDGDGIGDNADTDDDNDDWTDEYENNTSKTSSIYADSDKDGVIDPKDFFPLDPLEWADNDSDGVGDNADTDDDNDKVNDQDDIFSLDKTEWADNDSDGVGDNADTDDDNDKANDKDDAFALDKTEWQDNDSDGVGSNTDINDNNKGPMIKIDVPSKIVQNKLVTFSSANSFDPDGKIKQIIWEQDNLKTEGNILTTKFNQIGSNILKITVIDDKDEQRSENIQIWVERNYFLSYFWLLIILLILIIYLIRSKHKKGKYNLHKIK